MTDIEGVITSLLFRHGEASSPARHVERLGGGAFHVDYHDPDHVYLVTVRQVPRIPLPLQRPLIVGEVDGVRVQLVRVALANHVEVMLDAEDGSPRQAAASDFMARHRQWEAQAERGAQPPPWPAELFERIGPEVADDVGTRYRFASGEAGGMGTDWEVRWSFLPVPPVTAQRLTLAFSSTSGGRVSVDLPLPPPDSRNTFRA